MSGGPESRAAAVGAATMIATHVGLRASRDALFLSEFDLDRLPLMVLGASLFSLVALPWCAAAMSRWTPARAVPVGFALSGGLLVAEWLATFRWPGGVAIALYLQIAALGAFLVSGFWSVVNERFDPRTARKQMGRIAAGAALGGLLGGIGIERLSAYVDFPTLLPVLGAFQLLAGGMVLWLGRGVDVRVRAGVRLRTPRRLEGIRAIGRSSYLAHIALLVLATTCAEILLDYVFKSRAVAVYDDTTELVRFFALFYAGVGVATFLLQTLMGQRVLERVGLAGTVAALPLAAGLGSGALLLLPGLASAVVVRGVESATRSSLFRSGYELLYTPVAVADKRSAKAFVDVGVDKLGDGAGAALVSVLLWLPFGGAIPAMLLIAVFLSLFAVWTARRLHSGYVGALRGRLVDHADELPVAPGYDTALMRTVTGLDLSRVLGQSVSGRTRDSQGSSPGAPSADPVVSALQDLRSGEVTRIRARLGEPLDPVLARQVILLLARDDVARDAMRRLRAMGPEIAGTLVDALLDRGSEFAIRRRVPGVLAVVPGERAVEGLVAGLQDSRFEVRFRCASGLARMASNDAGIRMPADRIREALFAELQGGPGSWRARRLRDQTDDGDIPSPLRRDPNLEHVFRLLGLILEREPLEIAFRGLHTDDRQLRGTALEYLESVLPPPIWTRLAPFLEPPGSGRAGPPPSLEAARSKLLLSQTSIEVHLEAQTRDPDRDSAGANRKPDSAG